MNIGGKKRENTENSDYSKRVGLFEAKVIAINPTAEQYKNLLNIECPICMVNLFDWWREKELKIPGMDACPLDKNGVHTIVNIMQQSNERIKRIEKMCGSLLLILVGFGCADVLEESKTKHITPIALIQSKVEHLNTQYCLEDNEDIRKVIVAMLQKELPGYPDDGLCGVPQQLEKLLKEFNNG